MSPEITSLFYTPITSIYRAVENPSYWNLHKLIKESQAYGLKSQVLWNLNFLCSLPLTLIIVFVKYCKVIALFPVGVYSSYLLNVIAHSDLNDLNIGCLLNLIKNVWFYLNQTRFKNFKKVGAELDFYLFPKFHKLSCEIFYLCNNPVL